MNTTLYSIQPLLPPQYSKHIDLFCCAYFQIIFFCSLISPKCHFWVLNYNFYTYNYRELNILSRIKSLCRSCKFFRTLFFFNYSESSSSTHFLRTVSNRLNHHLALAYKFLFTATVFAAVFQELERSLFWLISEMTVVNKELK